jgi:hypothetical protein
MGAALLASARTAEAVQPHALYVRRPDAVLAKERAQAASA